MRRTVFILESYLGLTVLKNLKICDKVPLQIQLSYSDTFVTV